MKARLLTPLVVALSAAPLMAEEPRKLDAHQHGVSAVQLAVEGDHVEAFLAAPGFDIVGFEHAASSKKDKAAVTAALARLEKADAVLMMDKAAGCQVEKVHAELRTDDGHDDHDHDKHASHKGHDDHKHEKHDDHDKHDHDKHAKHEKHDHDKHAHHEHKDDKHQHDEDKSSKSSHSEFVAHYHFECANPAALKTVSFPFFESFPNAGKVQVEFVTANGSGAATASRDASTVNLR